MTPDEMQSDADKAELVKLAEEQAARVTAIEESAPEVEDETAPEAEQVS